MHVVLDASPLGTGRGGDETYLHGLIDGLALTEEDGTTFPVLLADGEPVPGTIHGRPEFPVTRVPRRPGAWHFAVTLPATARRLGGADLVHSVTHAVPGVWRLPTALTVGDLSFLHRPQDYPPAVRMRLNTVVPRQVRHARAVLAPSRFSRDDIVDSYGVPSERVHVVPNCVRPWVPVSPEEAEAANAVLASRGVREPFLLYLGNLHPRKNVGRLVEAFAAARASCSSLRDTQLVVAGGHWWGSGDGEEPEAGDPAVVRLGRVSDVVRRHLLERAAALAYVSLFEGFGLPPLEAMSARTPVLGSAIPALQEVCGDAAVLVDPLDVDAVAAGVVAILTDEALRERCVRRGLERCASFDVRRTGEAARAAFRCGLNDGR